MREMTTVLVIPVPDAEPLVGAYRQRHDPSGAWGIPPHVTVLTPFVAPSRIDDAMLAELGALFAEMPSFAFRFEATGRFPGVLYLVPEPVERFRALTERLEERFPEFPPYGGAHDEIVPHLTVLHDCADCLCERVAPRLEEQLPLVTEAREVLLFEGANAEPGWVRRARFPLGSATA